MLRERTGISDRRVRLIVVGSVVLAAFAVYANALANGFAYDDEFIIKTNDLVHGLGNLGQLLTAPYWPQGFIAGLYRPLTLLSFAVDWTIWNGNPFGFHLFNVLLHATVSGLVTLLLLSLFPWWSALLGGLVFAVHSVHTEAVANIVGRGELFVALFTLVACLVYMRAVRSNRLSLGATVLIAVCYALAGLSKELGVVMPGLLLVTDIPLISAGQVGRLRDYVRKRLSLYVVLTGVLLLIFAVRWLALGVPLENRPDRVFAIDSSFSTRLFTMSRVWPRYFELLLFPLDLSADYSPAVILPVDHLTPSGFIGFLLVLVTLTGAVALFRRAPEFTMSVAWVAIALLPVSNLLVMAEIVLAERTLYLPSVAVSVVVALLLTKAPPARRRWLNIALVAWLVGFSIVTVRRNPVWEDTYTLFEDLRRKHPESSRLLYGIGTQFYGEGDWEEAKKWFRRSLEIWPHHAPYKAEYALYLLRHDEYAEADSMAASAVRLKPGFGEYWVLLALIRAKSGNSAGVLKAAQAGLAAAGEDASLYALMVDSYATVGEYEKAIEAQRSAMRVRRGGPTWVDWFGLARLQAEVGDTAAAVEALEKAGSEPNVSRALVDSAARALKRLP